MKQGDKETQPLWLVQAVRWLVRLCVWLGRLAFQVVAMVTPLWIKKLLCWGVVGGGVWVAMVAKPWRGW